MNNTVLAMLFTSIFFILGLIVGGITAIYPMNIQIQQKDKIIEDKQQSLLASYQKITHLETLLKSDYRQYWLNDSKQEMENQFNPKF